MVMEQKAHQRRQEQHAPHDGVDDGFLSGLFVKNAHISAVLIALANKGRLFAGEHKIFSIINVNVSINRPYSGSNRDGY
jgi:hypothetical protein